MLADRYACVHPTGLITCPFLAITHLMSIRVASASMKFKTQKSVN